MLASVRTELALVVSKDLVTYFALAESVEEVRGEVGVVLEEEMSVRSVPVADDRLRRAADVRARARRA